MDTKDFCLYHYYDKTIGPFVNLSDLEIDKAKAVLEAIKTNKPNSQSAKRHATYMEDRLHYESILRDEFIKKGGKPRRKAPHYMVVGHSSWLASSWFENTGCISFPISKFDMETISFTYGDSHPVFSPRSNPMDDKEYRRKLYTFDEISEIIRKYGLPQDWNNDGKYGPERYVEAHIWDDEVISHALQ